jgi:mannose-6-phosphate isomerase-like protein (cupin superfamily)
MHPFPVEPVEKRLLAEGGGYEVVHAAPGIEVGVYVLIAPAPDDQKPHEDDEIYVVLHGSGAIVVEGERVPLDEGDAVFVEALAEHRFVDYETLSVLVVFTPPAAEATPLRRATYA